MRRRGVTDLVRRDVGRLRVIARAPRPASQRTGAAWSVRCRCGTEQIASTAVLVGGRKLSCGCLNRERRLAAITRHGLSRSPLKGVLKAAIARCHRPSDPAFAGYGGRGITVCDRWRYGESGRTGLELFVADMGPRPHGMMLERVDNEAGYSPENCTWATARAQQANRRCTIRVTFQGEEIALAEAVRRAGDVVTFGAARQRLRRGWSVDQAVTMPAVHPGRPGSRAA